MRVLENLEPKEVFSYFEDLQYPAWIRKYAADQ